MKKKKRNQFILGGVAIFLIVVGLVLTFGDGMNLQGMLSRRLLPWVQNYAPNAGTNFTPDTEYDFRWNSGLGVNQNLSYVNMSVCFNPVGKLTPFSCFTGPIISNHYTMTNLDWAMLRTQLFGNNIDATSYKLDWYVKVALKRANGNIFFIKSAPWVVYLDTVTCTYPYIRYRGQCSDPVPPCRYAVPNAIACIDKIMDTNNDGLLERFDHFNFSCPDGYEKVDESDYAMDACNPAE
jgi:hypothetical protein